MSPREMARGSERFQPMLATPGKETPEGEGDEWVFEPKYDGIRIVALVVGESVALMTRNGLDKCRQFPEITGCLRELGRKLRRNLVLDGEIVALDARGAPARFQELQGRMHLLDEGIVEHRSASTPAAYVAFDILVDGGDPLWDDTWDARRRRLERVMRATPASAKRLLRLSDVAESAAELLREAETHGWEGIMAKRRDGKYEPGRRVRHWQKLKLDNRQELVVGGWTEPRNSRKHFGALLLGYYDEAGDLVYAGHTGTGFSNSLLDELFKKLRSIERTSPPFVAAPKTNERAHWVDPKYVAEVKFNEWTSSGVLRHPVFVGLRDDKDPRSVVREPSNGNGGRRSAERSKPRSEERSIPRSYEPEVVHMKPRATRSASATRKTPAKKPSGKSASTVLHELRASPRAARATLHVDATTKLEVTNLGKIFFPVPKITKGRLLEYYAEVSPYLLPALADRPLVLKRYPNGIKDEAFYQQKAPDKVPPGIRVEAVADDGITTQRRLIAGNLATLLYIVQLGAVSTDPWHSRVQSIAEADYSIVDLDPGPGAKFKRVIQVARWVKEELDELGLHGVPKTSGASGIHVVLPLPPGASYEVSRVLAELVARRVNEKHPKETTVKRAVKTRPTAAVYVDYLQNIRGKTVASVYSARAETYASVSTPLKWTELTDDLDPRDFTVENVPRRLKRVGDLWGAGMRRPNRLPGIVGDAAA